MKQVIARIRKGNRTLKVAYFYSKSQYDYEIVEFARDIQAGQTIQISFGRTFVRWFDYEDIMYDAHLDNETIEEKLNDLLHDDMGIHYHLCTYLPRY